MIVGIGTDIVNIERMEAMLGRQGDAIAKRILHESEWQQFKESSKPAAFLAKRFAAKEAASKAFGTGFRDGLSLKHIIVKNDKLGKPELKFEHQAESLKNELNISKSFLSLSDEETHAVAYVILEK